MKKILSIAIGFALVASVALTQTAYSQAGSVSIKLKTTAGIDSANISNSAVGTIQAPVSVMYNKASIQVDLKKVSGTPSAGVLRLKASNTGLAGTFVRILPTDSLIVGNITTKTYIFKLPDPNHIYSNYQVEYTGGGTAVVTMKATAIAGRDH